MQDVKWFPDAPARKTRYKGALPPCISPGIFRFAAADPHRNPHERIVHPQVD